MRNRTMRRAALCACLTLVLLVGSAAAAVAGPLSLSSPKRLNVQYEGGWATGISGSRVVWTDSDGDYEIVVGDASSDEPPKRLTNNADEDQRPLISGDWVVWEKTIGGDVEIYRRRVNAVIPINTAITDNTFDDRLTDFNGTRAAWSGPGSIGDDDEIGVYDFGTSTTIRLTANEWDDDHADVSGNRVVWESHELGRPAIRSFTFGNFLTSTIAEPVFGLDFPVTNGTYCAWQSRTPYGARVYVQTPGGLRVFGYEDPEDVALNLNSMRYDGTLVSWRTYHSPSLYDLYVYDTSKSLPPVQLFNDVSTTTTRMQLAVVDDPYVVFDNAGDLYVWDKSTRSTSRLTQTVVDDRGPLLDGTRVAWTSDGGADVYSATLVKSTPALTLSAPSTINYGASAKVAGSLKWGTSVLAGRKVALEYSSNGTTWKSWKTVTTDAAGAFAAYAKPVRRTFYRAKFAGDAAYAPKTSPSRRVLPRVYLSKPGGPKSIKQDTAFTSVGYLKPRHTAGTKPVRILCYRKVSGVYRLKKTYYAKVSNYSTYSKYKASVTLPSAGSWRIRAYYPTTTTNYKKYSTYRYITAK